MSRSRFAVAAFLALSLASVAPPAGAQTDQTGVLEGAVSAAGQPVAAAVVLAFQPDGSYPRDGVTDAAGRFRFGFLPPGSYRVQVEAEGLVAPEIPEVRVSAGQTARVTIALEPSTFAGEVTVVAEPPVIDTRSNDRGSRLDSAEIDLLPTSRTATDLVVFTPGAKPDGIWGGSTSQANSYQVDGVVVNQPGFGGDFLLPSVDWIEELEVKGLGAGAEYGNFQGGLVNIVTKSGTNTLRGAVRGNWEDESLNSTVLDAREAGAERDGRWELGAELSGPIVRDEVYYFLSASQAELTTNIVDGAASADAGDVVFLPTQERRTETKLFGKLSWQPTERDVLAFVVGEDDVETDNRGLDSFTAPEAAQTQDSPATFWSAAWQRVLGRSNLLEVKYTGYDGADDRRPRSRDLPAVQILGGNRDLFANAVYTRERSLESQALSAALDSFFATGSVEHRLKVGAEADRGDWLETRFRNGGFTWRPERGDGPFDPENPATWGFISSDWGGDIRLDAEMLNAAVYVQDYLTITPRLTLSAGLRYGIWQGDLTPGFGGGGQFQAIDDRAIDPRLGIVWDLAGDGRWVANAHWGRYHQSLFALMFDRTAGGDVFTDFEYWDWDADELPDPTRRYSLAERDRYFVFFDSDPAGSEVGPVVDYEQPYVDQAVLSLEHDFGAGWRAGLTYVNRKNERILALVDRNLASNYTLYRDVAVIDYRSGDPILDQNGRPLVLPELWLSNRDIQRRGRAPGLTPEQIAALPFDQDLVLTNAPGAKRTLDQVQATVGRRTARWSLDASVVWTELEGNFYSVSGYEDPFGTGSGSYVEPNKATNADGRIENSSEWEVKLRLSGDLFWGLRGGLFALWSTGETYTPTYQIDTRNHDFVLPDGTVFSPSLLSGVNGETIFLERRGSRELQNLSRVDLYLERPIDLGRVELVLGVDVFNLFNSDSERSVNSLVNDQDPAEPTTLFGAVRLRQLPRTIRLSASVRF